MSSQESSTVKHNHDRFDKSSEGKYTMPPSLTNVFLKQMSVSGPVDEQNDKALKSVSPYDKDSIESQSIGQMESKGKMPEVKLSSLRQEEADQSKVLGKLLQGDARQQSPPPEELVV